MNNYMSVGDAIERFLAKYKLQDKVLIQEVLTDWERFVGTPIASNTEKVWFEKGTLFIKVSSPTWRNELSMGRFRLKQMINQKVNKELVEEVRIVM
jgi:predicted nucleic acid-binding Zn ribbon protein